MQLKLERSTNCMTTQNVYFHKTAQLFPHTKANAIISDGEVIEHNKDVQQDNTNEESSHGNLALVKSTHDTLRILGFMPNIHGLTVIWSQSSWYPTLSRAFYK